VVDTALHQHPDSDTERNAVVKSDSGNTATGTSSSAEGARRPRRINVAVTSDMIGAIELIMKREDISLTEAVRRLISYGDFVYRAIREDDSELLVRNGDKMKEVVLLT
jgi:hypothetical protein